MALRRFAAGAVALAFAATGLVACGNDEPAAPLAEGDTIRIGTTDREKEAWSVFEKKAADAGIDLEVVEFSEYPPVNTALSEGELDVNLFQHLKYLAQYNVGSDQDLTPIGSTEIVPLALFWTGGDKVEDIEDGTEVVIPNDSTNQGPGKGRADRAQGRFRQPVAAGHRHGEVPRQRHPDRRRPDHRRLRRGHPGRHQQFLPGARRHRPEHRDLPG